MEKNMKYSVLMSVYGKDNPNYLEIAIKSMLNQTVPPEQYVIVVDGPVPEAIMEVIERYRENKDLFTIIELKENGGLANALNIGLEACRNEFVARMDADDISLPKRCEKELEYFCEYPELVVCGCNLDEFYNDVKDVRTSRVVPTSYEEIKKFMRRRQAFNHATVIYRKSKVISCGGYPQLNRKEDFDLFSRMINEGCYGRNIGESLYLCRAGEENYRRRKSWLNFKSAIRVYMNHLNRGGCTIIDFIVVCMGEMFFCVCPFKYMKKISDMLLRERKVQ